MNQPGYVTFEVRGTTFAVPVGEVKQVLRAATVRLLPSSERTVAGRALMLADAGGAAVPALDLRGGSVPATGPGGAPDADVLLARDPGRAGLVVDRVVAVLRPGELVPEVHGSPALPSYAAGVLRPVGGGDPVLLVDLPRVADAGDPRFDRTDEPALGEPVLGAVEPGPVGAAAN